MIKQLGTKVYYCKNNGDVILIISDRLGFVHETTFDEDYNIYIALSERNKNTIGLIEFEYGEYFKLSKESTGVKVDLNTKKLIFTYDPLPEEPKELKEENEIEKLHLEIAKLKEAQKQQDKILLENSLKLAMLDIK